MLELNEQVAWEGPIHRISFQPSNLVRSRTAIRAQLLTAIIKWEPLTNLGRPRRNASSASAVRMAISRLAFHIRTLKTAVHGPLNMRKPSQGCWTCRLRRKKCDEQRPTCKECRTLHISTCSYGNRPAWMDGGVRQDAMAAQIKHEVKRQAPYRPRRIVEAAVKPIAETPVSELALSHQSETINSSLISHPNTSSVNPEDVCREVLRMRPFAQGDSVLLLFYLERVLPFLFPFYRPSPLQGSRAWIFDLVISSPVVRQAILCQSSYFFASAHAVSITTNSQMWEALLEQARDAFNVLRGSIQAVESINMDGSILGSVRAMAAIVQLQRFETIISCFDNCRAHLGAALSVFQKIIDVVGAANLASSPITFQTLLSLLGAETQILSTHQMEIPSSEQAAFSFSLAMLLFDDIIASTALQERPRLYDFHQSLLCSCDGIHGVPCIDLKTLMGCQNWVLRQIGEIAALDAWRKDCQDSGSLDIVQLVDRMTAIKQTLEAHVSQLAETISYPASLHNNLLPVEDTFESDDSGVQTETMSRKSAVVTRIWAHSAFLYLSIVVSGWQPANNDVRLHVAQALELLTHHELSPPILRAMAWPICVVSCLAESVQHDRIRDMVGSLQPASRFTTVRRAFDISERVCRDRAQGTACEFASYFQEEGALVLLV